jgi:FlaG/FlaF family flagellin (archaellin)
VILMVAITVILAAVIAVFVFGMAGDVEGTKSVGATAKQVDDRIVMTYHGGTDHIDVEYINTTVYDAAGDQTDFNYSYRPSVGFSYTTGPDVGTPQQERVTVTAKFVDGYEAAILDATL